ncbi:MULTISPECIES: 2-amino-4-hydroxy-6-hydroxymethyldihydropteridine diphosphokinase [unclassified Sulfitobacter]|uniref:2-amino-4-hydroxy-6- hydroxymethyldihydropteridine diphosphokinase n=1 Tax=unclassified Sulfitobacter TaxID=196795 RepID=UPI0020CBB7B5|nr:2-amino-4-hydroxy-6-hydroxymethyldihydropteridine diphosphokinase [Sulfitobacter sp. HGT1]
MGNNHETSQNTAQNLKTALVALGSNQSSVEGGPAETILRAIQIMECKGFKIQAASRMYVNPAFPAGSGPEYTNAVVAISTNLACDEILEILHEIEAELGRERDVRWGSRTVDLDLLAVEALVLPDVQMQNHWRALPLPDQMRQAPEQLILPHPRLQDRAFVLVPMAEITPDWLHPTLKKTVLQMLNDLPQQDRDEVRPTE